MKQVLKYAGYILLVALAGYLLYRFYYIIIWVLIAAVLSFIGHPLVRFFDRLHIRNVKMPHPVSAILALIVIVLVFLGLISIFVPLILSQANTISRIDVSQLAANLEGPLHWIDDKLHHFGAIPAGQTLQDFLVEKAKSVVSLGSVGTLVAKFISAAGNLFIGLFSILFIAFFFLKDENMFEEGILLLLPEKHHESTRKVIAESKNLLVRYYLGILLELLGDMTLITVGLLILGVKNALLIAFFGGLMNIIPYLGPVIGTIIGVVLGLSATLASGAYDQLFPFTIKLIAVFMVANFIDNNILVPIIYSKSVKSHPLEIFLVIIIGGGLAGLVGMLLAVPTYTLLRVIAREFLQEFRVVQKLTQTIDKK